MSRPHGTYRPNLWARLFLGRSWKVTLDARRGADISLAGADDIALMEVATIAVTSGILWHSVEIGVRGRMETLDGLTAEGARRLRDDLLGFVNHHLADLIERDKARLREVDESLTAMVQAKARYLAQSDVSRVVAALPGSAAQALSHPLLEAQRMPATVRSHLPRSFSILTDADERRRYNDAFVSQELRARERFFDDLGGMSLSDEQREACIRLEDSNLLVASAGSGKSATMVGKVAYVLDKGVHDAGEILVLAFNRSAAEELKGRIAQQLGVAREDLRCRVTTFHALGRSIIEEVEGRPPQMANWAESATGEARFIDGIIAELTDDDPEFRRLWVDLLTIHPKADIPPAAFDTPEEYERYVADANGRDEIGTLAGIFVRSLQEQSIANWLWRHSVEFEYERQIQTRDEDGSVRHVHPDFYYPSSRTVHEHLAIDADGTSPFPNYVKHAGLKRAGYARAGIDLFETTSAQSSDGSLIGRLRGELEKRRIATRERPLDEVMAAVKPVVATRYHKIIGVCIKHIRANRLTRDMLVEKAKSLHDRPRAERFAKAVWLIAQRYARKLDDERRIDFDSMIGDAVRLVETGRFRSPYSLVLVDEFQDISEPRANLIRALRNQKAFAKVFAVGDDWQSIYRFTGSDITIFTRFEANFGPSWQGRLQRTYRCNQTLADAAAGFVQRNPEQLRKSVTSTRPAVARCIRAIPVRTKRGRQNFREPCLRLLHRLDAFLGGNPAQWRLRDGHCLKVLVLWRYNMLDPFHGHAPAFENIEVSGLSFHRSKGLEADYTILLDVSEGDYGVPSRIEDDELLNLVIPRPEKFQYAEERRLFYVALTRASRGAFLLYDQRKPSRYIKELCDLAGGDVRFETVAGEPLNPCPTCVTGQLVERRGPNGSTFIGCSGYPSCRHTSSTAPTPATVLRG